MSVLESVRNWFIGTQKSKTTKRNYAGAESHRLNANKKPRNQSADAEMLGPFGADSMRAWARMLVRDNAYAWGVVDTIVSSVVGCGITAQSTYETALGDDIELINDRRDKVFADWCEVCEINGQYTFSELQAIIQREIVEAGEVLVRKIRTPRKEHRGIYRPVPFALELIEADRLAGDKDNYIVRNTLNDGNRIVRGVEMDDLGKPIAYWIYKEHPNSVYASGGNRTPERIPADEIMHLFRRDRIGQNRGISWFAPVLSWLRDLGLYVDNELQASAVASCFVVAIKSDNPIGTLADPDGGDTEDSVGNQYDNLQPGMVMHLAQGESIESANPGRPNSASEPWINLMLRGIAVGTGLSYEIVARDYSKTSYSSSRTSQLEDRRRFRRWQQYLQHNLCQPVWDAFCDAAALTGESMFPDSTALLDDRRRVAPVEWQTPEWEWVDPQNEQAAANAAINTYMSTYQDELGSRGMSYRSVFYQRAKEDKLRKQLGLLTPEERTQQMMAAQTAQQYPAASVPVADTTARNVAAEALNGAQITSLVDIITQIGTGAIPHDAAKAILAASFPTIASKTIDDIIDPIEAGSISADGVPASTESVADTAAVQMGSAEMMGLSTQQWNRNRKAIGKILDELANGISSEAAARVFLSSVGMSPANVDALIADALDGSVSTPLPAEAVARKLESVVMRSYLTDERIDEIVARQEALAAAPKVDPVQVNIHMPQGPAPTVNVTQPDINVASPIVNVASPTVNVAAPNVTVEQASKPTKTTITRDANGDIVETTTIPIEVPHGN